MIFKLLACLRGEEVVLEEEAEADEGGAQADDAPPAADEIRFEETGEADAPWAE